METLAQKVTRKWHTSKSNKGPSEFVHAVLASRGASATDDHIEALRLEALRDPLLAETFERHIPRLREVAPSKVIPDWATRVAKIPAGVDIFYVLPRILRPKLIVETGVAAGSMTSFLLAALNKNQEGELHSYDLAPVAGERTMDWTAKGEDEVGFLIPEPYKARWRLTFGDATYELPKAYSGESFDWFFHDSDHTYEHMTYEYAFALKHLAPGGLVISDDIQWNSAFYSFFGGMQIPVFTHSANPTIGIAAPA